MPADNIAAIDLTFPPGWLDENPLTRADLETDAQYPKKAGFHLLFH
jgi:hypothetical protein